MQCEEAIRGWNNRKRFGKKLRFGPSVTQRTWQTLLTRLSSVYSFFLPIYQAYCLYKRIEGRSLSDLNLRILIVVLHAEFFTIVSFTLSWGSNEYVIYFLNIITKVEKVKCFALDMNQGWSWKTINLIPLDNLFRVCNVPGCARHFGVI